MVHSYIALRRHIKKMYDRRATLLRGQQEGLFVDINIDNIDTVDKLVYNARAFNYRGINGVVMDLSLAGVDIEPKMRGLPTTLDRFLVRLTEDNNIQLKNTRVVLSTTPSVSGEELYKRQKTVLKSTIPPHGTFYNAVINGVETRVWQKGESGVVYTCYPNQGTGDYKIVELETTYDVRTMERLLHKHTWLRSEKNSRIYAVWFKTKASELQPSNETMLGLLQFLLASIEEGDMNGEFMGQSIKALVAANQQGLLDSVLGQLGVEYDL